MSQHRFKPPKRASVAYSRPRANAGERELRKMAALIPNQRELDSIMLQVTPEHRQAGLDRIRPFLNFRARAEAPADLPL